MSRINRGREVSYRLIAVCFPLLDQKGSTGQGLTDKRGLETTKGCGTHGRPLASTHYRPYCLLYVRLWEDKSSSDLKRKCWLQAVYNSYQLKLSPQVEAVKLRLVYVPGELWQGFFTDERKFNCSLSHTTSLTWYLGCKLMNYTEFQLRKHIWHPVWISSANAALQSLVNKHWNLPKASSYLFEHLIFHRFKCF